MEKEYLEGVFCLLQVAALCLLLLLEYLSLLVTLLQGLKGQNPLQAPAMLLSLPHQCCRPQQSFREGLVALQARWQWTFLRALWSGYSLQESNSKIGPSPIYPGFDEDIAVWEALWEACGREGVILYVTMHLPWNPLPLQITLKYAAVLVHIRAVRQNLRPVPHLPLSLLLPFSFGQAQRYPAQLWKKGHLHHQGLWQRG